MIILALNNQIHFTLGYGIIIVSSQKIKHAFTTITSYIENTKQNI